MKRIFISYVAISAIVVMLITACSKSTFDINNNPNSPTDSSITYDVILPGALNNSATVVTNNWGWLQNWMGFWARSGDFAPNLQEETYNITNNFQTGVWNGLYNVNFDLYQMQLRAKREGATFYEGISRIMLAHNFAILVDFYNNIPYKNVFQGSKNLTPTYDKGVDVYKDLLRQIDTGMAMIRAANPVANRDIATNDIMFKGNKNLWARFGNTLKLRLLIHNSGVNTFNVTDEIARITAEGSGFLGAGQNAEVNPGYRDDRPNPFYNAFFRDVTNQPADGFLLFRANEYAANIYEFNADPRGTAFYTPVGGNLVGVPYGANPNANFANSRTSSIGRGVAKSSTQSSWVLTSAESFLLQAEAAQRGWIGGSPKVLMEQGILESFTYLNVPNPAAATTAYLTINATWEDVDINAATTQDAKLFTILSQKYYALNTFAPFEVYTDFRRTDIVYGLVPNGGRQIYASGPPISVSPANRSTKIPTRLLYPQAEYNFNAANVSAEGTIDRYNRVFWDAN